MEQTLDSGRVAVNKEQREELSKLMMDEQGIGKIAFESKADHAAEFLGESVANHGDNADGAESNQRESDAIVAGNHHKVGGLALDNVVNLSEDAARFLDGDNLVREIKGEAEGCFSRHVHSGSAGNIIPSPRRRPRP